MNAWDVEALARALDGERSVEFAASAQRDSARLVQGSQADLDLFLADTLVRASAGLEQIYAPGLSTEVHRALAGGSARVLQQAAPSGALRLTDSPGPGVRQVHRLSRPASARATQVARHYLRTVPRFAGLRCTERGSTWHLGPLLRLHWDPISTEDRVVLRITGGWLGTDAGRLEIREVLGGECMLVAVVDFEPRLPWAMYRISQAPVHGLAMHLYGRIIRDRDSL